MTYATLPTVESGLTVRQGLLLVLAFLAGLSLCTLSGCPH